MDNKVIAGIVAVIIVIAAVGVYFGTQGGDDNNDVPTLSVIGSTTVTPVMSAIAENYEDARLEVGGNGSSQGVNDTLSGAADIGMISRDLTQNEIDQGLVGYEIGKDAVAIIVDKDAGISSLSIEQLHQIYSGEVTNWSQVGGNDLEINPIVREAGSGTRDCFDSIVDLKDVDMTGFASANANGTMVTTVEGTTGAIGYIGLGYIPDIDTDVVCEVEVDGVLASAETALDGTYKLVRGLFLITLGEATGDAKAVIDYVLSDEGQQYVVNAGYIAL